MKFLKRKKKDKLEKHKIDEVTIIIPSLDKFYFKFKEHIHRIVMVIDSEEVLKLSESERMLKIVTAFQTVALNALTDTLIDAGYKTRKVNKWNPKNWL